MALPNLRGTDHIGFTVPDLEEAHDFFVETIGCEHIYTLGPFQSGNDWMQTHLNVHPRTVMREVRLYRCGFGSNFEIFQYEPVGEQQQQPANSDIGGHHLGFYVDDLDLAVDYLRDRNVQLLGEPTSSGAASAGQRWIYFLTPWGMQCELVSFPRGKAYENDTRLRLWDPRTPRI